MVGNPFSHLAVLAVTISVVLGWSQHDKRYVIDYILARRAGQSRAKRRDHAGDRKNSVTVSLRLRQGLWGEDLKRDRDAVIVSYWWD